MRTGTATLLIAGLALGFGSGWWARSLKDQDPAKRASREAALRKSETDAREEVRGLREELRSLKAGEVHDWHDATAGGQHGGEIPPPEPLGAGDAEGGKVDPKDNPMAKMFEAWRPMLEVQVSQMAKGRATSIAGSMELETGEAKQLADALGAEATRQLDEAWEMIFGDAEIDPDVLGVFQGLMSPEPSEELERSLTSFMTDAEIADFRDEYKQEHKKQQERMVEMTISMMNIPDLSDAQRDKLRGVYGGTDPMRDWNTHFAKMMREPERITQLLSDKDRFAEELLKAGAPQQEQLRSILTPEQLKAAEQSQKNMVEMMRRQMEMFSPAPKKAK